MKECYGNYMKDPCVKNGGHRDCSEAGTCFGDTNEKHGLCDCEFKKSCHVIRQWVQDDFRKKYSTTVKDCDFYKMINERIKDS